MTILLIVRKGSMERKHINVVAAIICHDGKYLATQRNYGEFKGGWEFPGGKMEMNESPEEALVREIQEELQVSIQVDRFLLTVNHSYEHFDMTMHCYMCSLLDQQLTLTVHEAAKWLSVKELDSVNWLAADVAVVEALKIL